MKTSKKIRWQSPDRPPRGSGVFYVRDQNGKVYEVVGNSARWVGKVPGWARITGWRRTKP